MKLLTLALLAGLMTVPVVAPAETISFTFSGHQDSINVNFVGSGSFTVPNGTVTANLGTVQGFNAVLYDIMASQNINYAYDTYHFAQSDLTQFTGTFGSDGAPQTLAFRTDTLDPNNGESNIIVENWSPNAVQPTGNVGGIGVGVVVTSSVIPEPLSLALCGLGIVGLYGARRRQNPPSRLPA